MQLSSSTLPMKGIKRVIVRKLFGRYDYSLPEDSDGLNEIAILYGDNGSGKTTILSLIYHLLSPANDRGHRSAISRVPFSTFGIELHDGTQISASKETPDASNYLIAWSGREGQSSIAFDPKSEGRFSPSNREKHYLDFLRSLNLSVVMLSADREFYNDELN